MPEVATVDFVAAFPGVPAPGARLLARLTAVQRDIARCVPIGLGDEVAHVADLCIWAELVCAQPAAQAHGTPMWFKFADGFECNCVWSPALMLGVHALRRYLKDSVADSVSVWHQRDKGAHLATMQTATDLCGVAVFLRDRLLVRWTDMPCKQMRLRPTDVQSLVAAAEAHQLWLRARDKAAVAQDDSTTTKHGRRWKAHLCRGAAALLYAAQLRLRDLVPKRLELSAHWERGQRVRIENGCTGKLVMDDTPVRRAPGVRHDADERPWYETCRYEWLVWLGRYMEAVGRPADSLTCMRLAVRNGAQVLDIVERERIVARVHTRDIPQDVTAVLKYVQKPLDDVTPIGVPPVPWDQEAAMHRLVRELLPLGK